MCVIGTEKAHPGCRLHSLILKLINMEIGNRIWAPKHKCTHLIDLDHDSPCERIENDCRQGITAILSYVTKAKDQILVCRNPEFEIHVFLFERSTKDVHLNTKSPYHHGVLINNNH